MLKNVSGYSADHCRLSIYSSVTQRSALACAAIVGIVLFGSAAAWSQASGAQVPDAPDAATAQVTKAPAGPAVEPAALSPRPQQTPSTFGILSSYRVVNSDIAPPPESPKQKFVTTTEDSFNFSAVFVSALVAGYGLAANSTPEFGHGGVGYGRYLWHSAADRTVQNYMVGFIFPVATREDNRYYILGRGGFWHRTGYAMSRSLVTRTDSGRNAFNFSEVVGSGASAGVSIQYYPSKERTFSQVSEIWGLNVGLDAASFCIKEFWPDVSHRLFHSGEPKR